MKKSVIFIVLICFGLLGCIKISGTTSEYQDITELRSVYSSGKPTSWPKPTLDATVDKDKFQDIGLLSEMEFPADNPYTKEKADLGKKLFYDPRLSGSGQISCANCHNPELAWTDNITRSFGHDRQNGSRNAMTIINSGYATSLFWDGRASSLEDQAQFPIMDQLEMNEHLDFAVGKLNEIEGYKNLFQQIFGTSKVTLGNIQKAIATFERTLTSGKRSKFDQFISGKSDAFSDQEVLGLHLFRTKAQCINCHNTGYFSDNQFHNDGQALFGTKDEDFGRYNVTKNKEDLGSFRTPTLREVSRTGPWMHNGHFPSLLDIVEFYNLGNPAPIQKKYSGTERDSLIPIPSPLSKKLDLTKEEIRAVVAFLETLSTPVIRIKAPELPSK